MTTPTRSNPEFVYKIAGPEAFDDARASGRFTGMPIDLTDGYIHLSTAGQLGETLSLHFRGQSGLVVFALRTSDLGAGLRWEPSRGGQLFPHFYGILSMSAMAWHETVDVGSDGATTLPGAVQ